MAPPSMFLDRESPPGERELKLVLGPAGGAWEQFIAQLSSDYPPLNRKWSYSGKAYGWALQLKQKKQTIVYLIPCAEYFTASFAVSRKVCEQAKAGKVPAAVAQAIGSARLFPEGRNVRLDVRRSQDLANVLFVVALKMGC